MPTRKTPGLKRTIYILILYTFLKIENFNYYENRNDLKLEHMEPNYTTSFFPQYSNARERNNVLLKNVHISA